MPASRAKTKAGKARFVAKTMGEWKEGNLRSSSGQKVTNPKQAIAIGLSQTGQSRSRPSVPSTRDPGSKPPSERKRRGSGGTSGRLSRELDRRLDEKNAVPR